MDNLEEETPREPGKEKQDYLLPASPHTITDGDLKIPLQSNNRPFGVGASIVVAALIIGAAWIYTKSIKTAPQAKNLAQTSLSAGQAGVQNEPAGETIEFPLIWGNLGVRMIGAGVIKQSGFEAIYARRGGLTSEKKELLAGQKNNAIRINQQNAGFILNFLWAFGLSNKNPILEEGPMADSRFGDPSNFASTGGWTLAEGNVMGHYSAHPFVVLTEKQQELVERVSKNVYRPCCNNSTYFPDCNHGMAMLGLLELLAAQGTSEPTMYKTALQVNKFWFPDQYATIARYLENSGLSIDSADPKEILGRNYSSASGYNKILQEVGPERQKGGASCDVEGGSASPSDSEGGGCGI